MDVLPRANLLALRELEAQGTMTAAADLLGVTPGAVSQQISVLEERLGVALVRKSGRGVQLTDAAHVLVRHAARILAAQDEAVAAMQATRTEVVGRVTVGLFGSAASILPAVITAVARAHPGIEIRTREIDVDQALSSVRRSAVDLAFGLDYSDAPIPRDADVSFVPLRTERFGLAMCGEDPLSTGPFDLADARDRQWILPPGESHYGFAMRAACRRAGFEPNVVHEITDTAASMALAAAGGGVTPVTGMMRSLAPDLSLVVRPLEQVVERSLCLAEPLRADLRPSASTVASVIRSVLGEPA